MGKGNKFKQALKPAPAAGKAGTLAVQAGIVKSAGVKKKDTGAATQGQKSKAIQPTPAKGGTGKREQSVQLLKVAQMEPKSSDSQRQQPTSNQRRKARKKALKRSERAAKKASAAEQKLAGAEQQSKSAVKASSQPESGPSAEERPRKKARKGSVGETPVSTQQPSKAPAAAAAAKGEEPGSATEPPAKDSKKQVAAARRPPPPKPDIQTNLEPPKPGAVGNSNWAALKAVIGGGNGRRKEVVLKGSSPTAAAEAQRPQPRGSNTEPTQVLAVDCEMVGVGPDGARSSLARVCIVNEHGNVLLDALVRQKERVTDFRTRFSGIRPADIRDDVARPFEEVQATAAALFKDRILVGHAIHNDLKALLLSHPRKMIRDTSRFPPLMKSTAPGRKARPRALRHLAFELLGLGIQEGEHSPVEDARAALYLYQRFATEWERRIQTNSLKQLAAPMQLGGGHKPVAAGKSLAELAAKDVMVDL